VTGRRRVLVTVLGLALAALGMPAAAAAPALTWDAVPSET